MQKDSKSWAPENGTWFKWEVSPKVVKLKLCRWVRLSLWFINVLIAHKRNTRLFRWFSNADNLHRWIKTAETWGVVPAYGYEYRSKGRISFTAFVIERMIPHDRHGRVPLGSRGERYLILVAMDVEEPDISWWRFDQAWRDTCKSWCLRSPHSRLPWEDCSWLCSCVCGAGAKPHPMFASALSPLNSMGHSRFVKIVSSHWEDGKLTAMDTWCWKCRKSDSFDKCIADDSRDTE